MILKNDMNQHCMINTVILNLFYKKMFNWLVFRDRGKFTDIWTVCIYSMCVWGYKNWSLFYFIHFPIFFPYPLYYI